MEKILVRMPNWIGDFVMALPALMNILRSWQDKDIFVMSRPHLKALLPAWPNLKGFVPYPETRGIDKIGHVWAIARVLRPERFAKAILFQNAFEAALIARLGGISHIVGYDRDLRRLLLTRPVRYQKRREHHVHYYLRLLKVEGIEPRFEAPRLDCDALEQARCSRLLKDSGVSDLDVVMGIAPGAAYGPAKMWPSEYLRELIHRLLVSLDCHILLIGSKKEEALANQLLIDPERVHNLCGKTDLGTAKAVIKRCDVFLSNDSGLMHVAAALNVPVIAIFGSTDPTITGPISPFVKIFSSKAACSPCFRPSCPKGSYECLHEIKVKDVYEEITKLIGRLR